MFNHTYISFLFSQILTKIINKHTSYMKLTFSKQEEDNLVQWEEE